MKFDQEKIKCAVRMILEAVGEDVTREGLANTPDRVAKMYNEIFSGLQEDEGKHFSVLFHENHEELVILRDIPFYSICEHHLVPFYGKAHVAYIPKAGRVAGLSKLVRTIETISRRPQLQERITSTIVNTMMEKLKPCGALVIVEAEHMCMTLRGVKKPGSITVTTAARGSLKEEKELRMEALSLIKGSSSS